ncbi:hypothetical protein ISG33_05695 [Glaciecola sp. MH2013]|uniref:hypothetical protein n=1 Tax=Glaciecola sp. MH2013 TaxID=2785524 RepID=UPI00189D4AD1|nr:hypothetical protein [Glaciecola sp. MH2013]MBF7072891.1 hypothetical protein [Glaciecola sp. MH2013]
MQNDISLYKAFLEKEKLPLSYLSSAQKWFKPIIENITSHQNRAKHPLFIGINGCQGSGKSTLSAFLKFCLQQFHQQSVVVLSLDDFYLSKAERLLRSNTIHPLLKTRGVPGTHDTQLLSKVLTALANNEKVQLPRFDKSIDDQVAASDWKWSTSIVDTVIIEGWCWGTPAQNDDEIAMPINKLEEEQDKNAIWRRYVNQSLSTDYMPLYQFMHQWVFLRAPSFDSVYSWRCEQEHKLIQRNGATSATMTDQEIYAFIQYYQRLTEQSLCTLEQKCNWVFNLDNERNIIKSQYNA